MSPIKMYECPHCYRRHDNLFDAQYKCCPNDVEEIYVCSECDQRFYCKNQADHCCSDVCVESSDQKIKESKGN